MAIWIVKSEPSEYSYAMLAKDGRTTWSGVRNFQARNNLRAMKPGEFALYFHTGDDKAIVGIAKVLSAPAADPTAPGEDWTSVELGPHKALNTPVPLATLKATAATQSM